jgi:5-methylcytosine-specific restriction endonuclease McrA
MEDQPAIGFPKPKRIRDPELLDVIRGLQCLACYPGGQQSDTEAHHISTKGSGGDDVLANLMPLCRSCHSRWHAQTSRFVRENVSVQFWLEKLGRFDVLERLGILVTPG